jgi:serine/threonine protein kinase
MSGEKRGLLGQWMKLISGHSLQQSLKESISCYHRSRGAHFLTFSLGLKWIRRPGKILGRRNSHLRHQHNDACFCAFFRQILEGLATLHRDGCIHRDIKPGNLGVVSHIPPRAVIFDFGQATRQGTVKATPGAIGTKGYLAPEMERRPYGSGVDIWAMGVVGFKLFVSTRPQGWQKNTGRQESVVQHACSALQPKRQLSRAPSGTDARMGSRGTYQCQRHIESPMFARRGC